MRPLLAVADLMVTDHSSIGFEYLVLDRPLLVYDAPDLPRVARISAEKIELLRSAATVVRTPQDLAAAATAVLRDPQRASTARRHIARELFFESGRATDRSIALLRGLLYSPQPAAATERVPASRSGMR